MAKSDQKKFSSTPPSKPTSRLIGTKPVDFSIPTTAGMPLSKSASKTEDCNPSSLLPKLHLKSTLPPPLIKKESSNPPTPATAKVKPVTSAPKIANEKSVAPALKLESKEKNTKLALPPPPPIVADKSIAHSTNSKPASSTATSKVAGDKTVATVLTAAAKPAAEEKTTIASKKSTTAQLNTPAKIEGDKTASAPPKSTSKEKVALPPPQPASKEQSKEKVALPQPTSKEQSTAIKSEVHEKNTKLDTPPATLTKGEPDKSSAAGDHATTPALADPAAKIANTPDDTHDGLNQIIPNNSIAPAAPPIDENIYLDYLRQLIKDEPKVISSLLLAWIHNDDRAY